VNPHSSVFYCTPGDPDAGAPHPFMAAYWLASKGFSVSVVCMGRPQFRIAQSPLATVSTIRIGQGTARFEVGLFRRLLGFRMQSRGKGVFYVHGHCCAIAAGLALAGVPRRRIIYHTQDFLEPGRHPHWEFFERRFARRAGAVICNEPNRARFMASHYGLKRFPTIVRTALPKAWPRSLPDTALRAQIVRAARGPAPLQDVRLIMHEGSYSPLRCGDTLLHALTRLPETHLLVLTGNEPASSKTQALKMRLSALGLERRVALLPRLPFDDLLRHTACCDAGMLLYINDGIGNFYQAPGRLTHYLGCGLPVVASNHPGLELLILKHQLGATCDPTSPEAVAAAIRGVTAATGGEAAARSLRLRELALGEFAYDTDAWQIEHIVRHALGET